MFWIVLLVIFVIVGRIMMFKIIILVIKLKFILFKLLWRSGIKMVIFKRLYIIEGILIKSFKIGCKIVELNLGEI